ncbi:SMP-30/gluconolactonase/LRE family protein [Peloplasma aerotolerans]|uniref:SMP-30/gluconolactonase/LRE family protein n=1 Tax=Peloplasma aerotolerans TaxID=3044389 RepID=A0AAW6UA71_9MOLU|nr:SMP-30/gluconolactonase/LRE family protein [Mariniplasma sp. M4Ah]MDI6452824.1 SMP-30/gluconolactonase/LRE family protein [Mariniplasma sp. M4Ah]
MDVKILAKGLKFPEGPVVTDKGNIYCVELLGGAITEFHRDTKTISRYDVGGAPNGMMVKDDRTLIFCDSKNNAIRSLDVKTGETKTLADQVNGTPLRAPNDLIQDSEGNILFTCPGGSQRQPIGYMCALNKNNEVSIIADNMYFPNGLLLINNEKNIIINETWQHRLLIGDWNKKTLKIENIRTFYTIGGNAEPDGLTLSKDNLIYAAVYGTGMIWVFDTKGTLINQIQLPGNCPTNLYFDHVGDLGLIVTEAEKGSLLSIEM